jgi:hypothetical protein
MHNVVNSEQTTSLFAELRFHFFGANTVIPTPENTKEPNFGTANLEGTRTVESWYL